MGVICPGSSSLCIFELNPVVGSSLSCSRTCPLNSSRLSFTRSKSLLLRNIYKQFSIDVRCPSFASFYPSNLNSGGDSDRKGKKERWVSRNVRNEGTDFSSGQASDKERIEMQTIRDKEEEKDDSYSTEVPEAASPGDGSRLWDFFKLWREKGRPPLTAKASGLDGEKIEIQWRDILDPTPENALAQLLIGLLGLAVLRIFWQLLLVSVTIVLAAFKYSVIAAILIALLVVFL